MSDAPSKESQSKGSNELTIKYNEAGDKSKTERNFNYVTEELEFKLIEWPSDGQGFMKSRFDELLSEKWDNAMENGRFWYSLDEVQRRNIDGHIGFIAQLNTKRFKERRKPEEINLVTQPFRKDKFNFSKVKENEILFNMRSSSEEANESVKENLVIINVSPIDYGHVLLVPDINSFHSQMLNYDAVRLSIEICLLSHHRALRIGFNSLCAFASVNHLHLHMLYIDHILPLDKVDVFHISNGLYELDDYPVRGLALQLEDHGIHQLARKVSAITEYLCENDTAHNLFICRHQPFTSAKNDNPQHKESTVRVFIFPKLSAPAINEFPFNSAALEIAGFLPVRDEQEFQELTETDVIRILNRYCFREDEFAELKDKISFLLERLDFI